MDFIGFFVLPTLIASLIIAFAGSKKLKIPNLELNIHKRQRFERIRWLFNEYIPSNEIPVLFQRGAVLKDSHTGKNQLQLKFINISPKQIKSAYATISFIDDAGDIMANGSTIQAEYLDVNCERNGTFGQKQLLELGAIGATHISVVFSKVVFVDGTVWRAGKDTHPQKPAKVTLLKSTLPPELQNVVEEEVICKPEILTNEIWRCTCGCLADNGDYCSNCHRTYEKAQEDTSVNTLKKQLQKRIAKQEQEALDEEIAKQKSKGYSIQFVFAILTLFFSSTVTSELTYTAGLLSAIYIILCCISSIATSILMRKAREDKLKDEESLRKTVRIQGATALISGILSVLIILMCPTVFIYAIPNIVYCFQLPLARNLLSKYLGKVKKH